MLMGSFVKDAATDDRMPISDLNEHAVINILATEKAAAWPALNFMLNGAFDDRRYLRGANKSGIEGLFVGPEISRNELEPIPNKLPGDIDLLVIPFKANRELFTKTIAVEVKILK